MKKILLHLVLAFPMTTFANTLSFECISVDLPRIHKFDAHGVVVVDDSNKVEGIVNIITEKSDATHSTQTFDEVRVTGYIRHFKAGEISKDAFDQLVLKTDTNYLKTLNLLLGINDKIASRALSIDNFSYRSNCKIIK